MRLFRQYFATSGHVRRAAKRAFPHENLTTIMAILDAYGTESHEPERNRVQLAIITLSEGDVDKLRHFVAAAKQDYRDVLWWAEYPRDRDSQTELEDVENILKAFGDDTGEQARQ